VIPSNGTANCMGTTANSRKNQGIIDGFLPQLLVLKGDLFQLSMQDMLLLTRIRMALIWLLKFHRGFLQSHVSEQAPP